MRKVDGFGEDMAIASKIKKSFVIPVLDYSPHSAYNIKTLLNDLEDIEGEVICIFNSREMFEALKDHNRIDKYCYNSLNAGVSRSWNIGINLSESDAVFIMNADIHILPKAINKMLDYLFSLEAAVLVGPQGSIVNFPYLTDKKYFDKGSVNMPVRVHAVSGFLFAIHRQRFFDNRLNFDVRYSPCFMEELDLGLQIIKAGLSAYVVPVTEFDHDWGISGNRGDRKINYFGKEVSRDNILILNRQKFIEKWSFCKQAEENRGILFAS